MKFFQLIPPGTHFDFIGKFKHFVIFSIITIGIVFAGLYKKGLNFGVDFTGGTVVQIKFNEPIETSAVRTYVDSLGEPDASVVHLGEDKREFLITVRSVTKTATSNTLAERLVEKAGANKITVQKVESVGPKVGEDLKWGAILSLIYSIIGITIYIWLRFDLKFAPGATVAMVHDLILATGFYVFSGVEFTITAVAALLTIAGYSVNDTIVIYDRVRDMLTDGAGSTPLSTTINRAINLTLSRTLLTSFITLISVLPVAIFCDGELRNFALAMAFGIFVGSYSTIYIASPMTIYIARFLEGRDPKKSSRTQTA